MYLAQLNHCSKIHTVALQLSLSAKRIRYNIIYFSYSSPILVMLQFCLQYANTAGWVLSLKSSTAGARLSKQNFTKFFSKSVVNTSYVSVKVSHNLLLRHSKHVIDNLYNFIVQHAYQCPSIIHLSATS